MILLLVDSSFFWHSFVLFRDILKLSRVVLVLCLINVAVHSSPCYLSNSKIVIT